MKKIKDGLSNFLMILFEPYIFTAIIVIIIFSFCLFNAHKTVTAPDFKSEKTKCEELGGIFIENVFLSDRCVFPN